MSVLLGDGVLVELLPVVFCSAGVDVDVFCAACSRLVPLLFALTSTKEISKTDSGFPVGEVVTMSSGASVRVSVTVAAIVVAAEGANVVEAAEGVSVVAVVAEGAKVAF